MENLRAISFGTTLLAGLFLWLLEGVIPFFLRSRSRTGHAALNLSIAILNLLILFPSSLLTASVLSETNSTWPSIKSAGLPFWAQAAIILILIDLWMYVWHRMNHQIRFLWRFHGVHHSDPSVDVTTAWRFHFVEILFGEVLRLPILMLIGAGIEDLFLYTIFMTPVIELHHSNVRIPAVLDCILRTVIPTPHMHRIHHSVERSEHDSNYGSMLSVWDRLFRSFQLSDNVGSIAQGLDGESSYNQQKLPRLLARPFRNAAAQI